MGLLKNVVSYYLQCGSSVFACFLDASKAFDLVKHSILFRSYLKRPTKPGNQISIQVVLKSRTQSTLGKCSL